MEDYVNSVAQQDVSVSTETVVSSVVGENFQRVLYVTSATVEPTMVTKATYESAITGLSALTTSQRALMTQALNSLFDYGTDVTVFIISADSYAQYKYKAYFTYIEPSYEINSETSVPGVATDMSAILSQITLDKEFSALFTDLAVPVSLAKTGTTQQLQAALSPLLTQLNALTEITVAARGSTDGYAFEDGYSPIMYQIGRTLGFLNVTGTPIGNAFDMAACNRADVLVTRDMSTDTVESVDATVATFFEDNNVCYFKPIGNGTAQLVNYGASSLRSEIVGVAWIRAYINYMTKIACAQNMTRMNTFKDAFLYSECLSDMMTYVNRFVALRRLTNARQTAPSFGEAAALSDGRSIVIPHAWEATYVDQVRTAKVSGTLYVAA